MRWMKFYPTDFMGDATVAAMSTEAVGAYILLLCAAWQGEPRGTLPLDDAVLSRLARLDGEGWNKVRSQVLAAFRVDGNKLIQQRMMNEAEDAESRHRALSEAGKRGAATRKARGGYGPATGPPNDQAIGLRMALQEARNQKPESEKQEEQKSESEDFVSSCERYETRPAAQQVWDVIPNCHRRGAAKWQEAWVLHVSRPGVDPEVVKSSLAAYYESPDGKGEFSRRPATCLRDEIWNESPEAWQRRGDDSEEKKELERSKKVAEESEEWLSTLKEGVCDEQQ